MTFLTHVPCLMLHEESLIYYKATRAITNFNAKTEIPLTDPLDMLKGIDWWPLIR